MLDAFTIIILDCYQPIRRRGHKTVIINDKLYMWGGYRRTYHLSTHRDLEKLQYLSKIDVLDVKRGLWMGEKTTGEPPLGLAGYGCAFINEYIYFFGGDCRHKPIPSQCSGYHNNLSQLDTTSKHWIHLSPSKEKSKVMKRAYGGMISAKLGNDDLLFIVCGEGPLPTYRHDATTYSTAASSISDRHCRTNECNVYNVSQRT